MFLLAQFLKGIDFTPGHVFFCRERSAPRDPKNFEFATRDTRASESCCPRWRRSASKRTSRSGPARWGGVFVCLVLGGGVGGGGGGVGGGGGGLVGVCVWGGGVGWFGARVVGFRQPLRECELRMGFAWFRGSGSDNLLAS